MYFQGQSSTLKFQISTKIGFPHIKIMSFNQKMYSGQSLYIDILNNIKTSYYVKRMTEHYFPLKIPINSNTTTSFSPEKQAKGTDGRIPAK